MPIVAAVVFLLAALAVPAPAAAQSRLSDALWPVCEVTGRGDLGNISPETLQMRLRRGGSCAVFGRPEARHFVVTPPRHGTLAVAGQQVTYRPLRGFTGSDSFVIAVSPRGRLNPIYTTVIVEVR
jgi:hypothetical protein